jgi:hypothetical protein
MKKFISLFLLLPSLVLMTASVSGFKRIDDNKGDMYFWPKTFGNEEGESLTIYQPQIIDWSEYKNIKARMVLSYKPNSKDKPLYGTAVLTANTVVDVPSKQVKLTALNFDSFKVLNLSADENEALHTEVQKILPAEGLVMLLARATASLQRKEKSVKTSVLQSTPPRIIISKKPAALVVLDGEPIWSLIKDNELQFAVNTNWDLLLHKEAKAYYIRYIKMWYTASDLQGPWNSVFKLPDALYHLPKTENWETVTASLPSKALPAGEAPAFFISNKPAELILIDGEPQLKSIHNTKLAWVSNTDSDLFFSHTDKNYYYLVSGRWFQSKQLNNKAKWNFATDRLPEDFKNIPVNSSRASIRVSVPGTIEAETAVIMAQIPHKVQVKKTGLNPEVIYTGKPDFQPVKDTELTYAVNTSSDVIYFEEMYYLCQNGIWFVSIDAKGPWSVATEVPKTIYQMPASSPLYHTTYVYVYGSDIDTVTVGYTAGYSNVYTSSGVVVYGSGWYYPPYYNPYYYNYPIYYSYPYTYGGNTYYNPNTGTYGRAGSANGPYGGAGYGAVYNPGKGTYTRATAAYGPSSAKRWVEAYNPRTNTGLVSKKGSDYYSSWGATAIKRDDKWAATGSYKNEQGSVRRFKTSEGSKGFVGRNENNLYAGKDGNVYRRNDDDWQKYGDGSWNSVDESASRDAMKLRVDSAKQKHPDAGSQLSAGRDKLMNSGRTATTQKQLNRDFSQRQYGQQRLNQQRSWQGGGSSVGRSNMGGGGLRSRR